MIKNYIKITVRNLSKFKAFSAINIAGLAIGIACCIVILLYVQSEVGYDAYHEKKDQIYRLTLDVEGLKSGNGWNHRTADRLNDSQFPGD